MAQKSNMPSVMLANLAGAFHAQDGFKKIISFMTVKEDYKIPISLFTSCIDVFCNIPDLGLPKEFIQDLATDLNAVVESRLSDENLTPSDIKENSLEEFKHIIRRLGRYFTPKADEVDPAEMMVLKIAHRFLTSPFFEKRIKGMYEFKYIQERLFNNNSYSARGKKDKTPFLPLDIPTYAKWIKDSKVTQFIFEENPHQELIKRTNCILIVLA